VHVGENRLRFVVLAADRRELRRALLQLLADRGEVPAREPDRLVEIGDPPLGRGGLALQPLDVAAERVAPADLGLKRLEPRGRDPELPLEGGRPPFSRVAEPFDRADALDQQVPLVEEARAVAGQRLDPLDQRQQRLALLGDPGQAAREDGHLALGVVARSRGGAQPLDHEVALVEQRLPLARQRLQPRRQGVPLGEGGRARGAGGGDLVARGREFPVPGGELSPKVRELVLERADLAPPRGGEDHGDHGDRHGADQSRPRIPGRAARRTLPRGRTEAGGRRRRRRRPRRSIDGRIGRRTHRRHVVTRARLVRRHLFLPGIMILDLLSPGHTSGPNQSTGHPGLKSSG
jgi:hypothetical protein